MGHRSSNSLSKTSRTLTLAIFLGGALALPSPSLGQACTGDVLFVGGCGRADMVGGSPTDLFHSLYRVLMALPDSTVICPGHDYGVKPRSTVGEEKRTNPYLQFGDDVEAFAEFRLNSRNGKRINQTPMRTPPG